MPVYDKVVPTYKPPSRDPGNLFFEKPKYGSLFDPRDPELIKYLEVHPKLMKQLRDTNDKAINTLCSLFRVDERTLRQLGLRTKYYLLKDILGGVLVAYVKIIDTLMKHLNEKFRIVLLPNEEDFEDLSPPVR